MLLTNNYKTMLFLHQTEFYIIDKLKLQQLMEVIFIQHY